MDTSGLVEGDPLFLVQRGFGLPEAAIFLRYYPRGSDVMIETAVFLRTGTVCPVSDWSRFLLPRDFSRSEYEKLVDIWARTKPTRKRMRAELMDFFEEICDYDQWRKVWILSGKLYRNYEHRETFDEDDPRKKTVINCVPTEVFAQTTDLIVGRMDAIEDQGILKATQTGPHAVVEEVLQRKWFSNECGGRKVIKGFMRDFKDALCGEEEGQWINLVVKHKTLSAFGLPKSFLVSEGHKKYPVPNYDQLILQCDGKDKARTLGMHRDVYPGSSATHVSTILGCVGGLGKEMLIWRGDDTCVPAWWRQEGLPCEIFDYVYKNTDSSLLQRIVIKPGQFVFMPRGLWHWVRPIPGAKWTVMVTSSFHTYGADFDSENICPDNDALPPGGETPIKITKRKRASKTKPIVMDFLETGRPKRRCRVVY